MEAPPAWAISGGIAASSSTSGTSTWGSDPWYMQHISLVDAFELERWHRTEDLAVSPAINASAAALPASNNEESMMSISESSSVSAAQASTQTSSLTQTRLAQPNTEQISVFSSCSSTEEAGPEDPSEDYDLSDSSSETDSLASADSFSPNIRNLRATIRRSLQLAHDFLDALSTLSDLDEPEIEPLPRYERVETLPPSYDKVMAMRLHEEYQ